MLPKIKTDHLQLNSYSRMRVDLAAQVRTPCAIANIINPRLISVSACRFSAPQLPMLFHTSRMNLLPKLSYS